MIWNMTRGQPAPRLRAASASVATSIDRRPASIARWANGRTRMMSMKTSDERIASRGSGQDRVDRHDADDEHDGRDGDRQQAQELDRALQARHPEVRPGHGRDEQQEHPDRGQGRDGEGRDDGLDEVRVLR